MTPRNDASRPPAAMVMAATVALAAGAALVAIEPALAQLATARPSGAASAAPGLFDGAWLWLLERQRELTGAMTNAVKRLKTESFWGAAAQLALVSFLYGVFHAAGPGHGKFVISSYALANARTLRRGVAVSFMAAFVQALSAIAIVGVLAIAVKATSLDIRRTEAWLETVSWGAIALLGAWLLWRSMRGIWAARSERLAPMHDHSHAAAPAVRGHGHAHQHHHGHDHAHRDDHHGHAHAQKPGHGHPHGHSHDHAHHTHAAGGTCSHCGHAHVATPEQLDGTWSWREAISIAFAIGIRPCTGALAVLIFALGIGLFAAGIMATFAMALGTAITVSVLATLAVSSRNLALRIGGGPSSAWASRIETGAAITGSALVMVMGTAFFLASLSATGTSPL